MEVPAEFVELLSATLSTDQNQRLQAEERLQHIEKTELQYPLVITAIAVDQNRDRVLRQLSLTLLKRFVLHSWSISSEHYTPNEHLDFLSQDQKSKIRQEMIRLLLSPDHIIRELAANIVPKIASADWPNDWPRFLEELEVIISHSNDVPAIISTLKVLREFISETLTDDAYFNIVPSIVEKLKAMQSDHSLLIRAKAQSVFRACMEQMEMYKDTTAYQKTVRTYLESELGPWVQALQQNLNIDVRQLSGDDFDAAVKLTYATYKTLLLLDRAFETVLQRYLEPLLEQVLTNLENIYPYYEKSLSSSPTPQLNRYIISHFGILQIILRAPVFQPDSSGPRSYLVHGIPLDRILFEQSFRFAQISDEAAKGFIENPESTIDDSPETLNRVAVRTAILSFAMEHFRVSYVQYWSETRTDNWRTQESSYFLIPAITSCDYDEQYQPYFEKMEVQVAEAHSPRQTNPIVAATAIASRFDIADHTDSTKLEPLVVLDATHSQFLLVKIQFIAAINRSIGIDVPRPTEEIIEGPNELRHFQNAVLQLINSLLPSDDLVPSLIQCLCCVIRLQPMFATTDKAMEYFYHFLLWTNGNPLVRFTLCETLEQFILPAFRFAEKKQMYFAEVRTEFLSKTIAIFEAASHRPKGDPLILTWMTVLTPLVGYWRNYLTVGTVARIFGSLVRILLMEDDVETLEAGQKLLSHLISFGYPEIAGWNSSDGKSGLAVLMMIIEKSLSPDVDESQRILAGPLIADLVQKAAAEIQPHLPVLLNVIISQLATATKPEFIQSLIHVFATLIVLNPPAGILQFCSNIPVSTPEGQQSGLQVLLRTWTETFEVLTGYNQIRLSVVALSRIFECPLDGIIVRGEEITEPASVGRIVTRSQRRKVRYTEIPVKLKILKLFIKELGNITEGEETNGVEEDTVAVHAEKADDEGWESEEDEEWDDVGEDMSSDLQEMETQEDILQGVNTKEFIVDFLKKAAQTGERWELTDSEIGILKVMHVI